MARRRKARGAAVTSYVEIDGQTYAVTIRQADGRDGTVLTVRLSVDGNPSGHGGSLHVSARQTAAGVSFVYLSDGRHVDAAITSPGGIALVQLSGKDLSAVVRQKPARRRRETAVHRSGETTVVAPMPGRVIRVLVQPGDVVAARQGLVVVEAMKMENELSAPRPGRVREVTVLAGASVESGRVLVVID